MVHTSSSKIRFDDAHWKNSLDLQEVFGKKFGFDLILVPKDYVIQSSLKNFFAVKTEYQEMFPEKSLEINPCLGKDHLVKPERLKNFLCIYREISSKENPNVKTINLVAVKKSTLSRTLKDSKKTISLQAFTYFIEHESENQTQFFRWLELNHES